MNHSDVNYSISGEFPIRQSDRDLHTGCHHTERFWRTESVRSSGTGPLWHLSNNKRQDTLSCYINKNKRKKLKTVVNVVMFIF